MTPTMSKALSIFDSGPLSVKAPNRMRIFANNPRNDSILSRTDRAVARGAVVMLGSPIVMCYDHNKKLACALDPRFPAEYVLFEEFSNKARSL
jgi:hypothetical protein